MNESSRLTIRHFTGIDTRRHFHRQRFGFFYQPLAAALDARIRNGLTPTPAFGAGLLYLEKTLLGADLTRTTATAADDRAATRLGTAAVTRLTML